MLRLQEANQPALQAPSFPGVENPTVILARTSRHKAGRVKVSSVAPAGPWVTAMLTAEASSRAQVKRRMEIAALPRLAVRAIPDKPKVMASSIVVFRERYGNESSKICRLAANQRTDLLLCASRFSVRRWICNRLRQRSTRLLSSGRAPDN